MILLTFNSSQNYIRLYLVKALLLIILSLLLFGCSQTSSRTSDRERSQALNRTEIALQVAENQFKNGKTPDLTNIYVMDLNADQRVRYYRLKNRIIPENDYNAKIRNYIEFEQYTSDNERKEIINQTWNYLQTLTEEQRALLTVYPEETTLIGWLELLSIYNNAQTMPSEPIVNEFGLIDDTLLQRSKYEQDNALKSAVSFWMKRNASHPAARLLPPSILKNEFINVNAPTIALFIPQQGNSKLFGDAILAGMRDVQKYDAQINEPQITIYDTTQASMAELVQQATQDGASLIVGPLLKKDVEEIATLHSSLPILALNQVDQTALSLNNICYFSLSPENEAQDAAIQIYSQNHRSPLLILPNTLLGQRIAEGFIKKWSSLTGNGDVKVHFFDPEEFRTEQFNNKQVIDLNGTMMSVSQGKLTPSFTTYASPTDAIYLYASSKEFMFIHSLLAMRNSTLPPLYIGSTVNEANLSTDTRLDLNAIQISDIPLILQLDRYQKQVPTYIKNDYFLMRLYAMGVDTMRLAQNYDRLHNAQGVVLNGLTGELSVVSPCQIKQRLIWGTYNHTQFISYSDYLIQSQLLNEK